MPSLLIQQFLGNQFCRSFLSRNLSVIVSADLVNFDLPMPDLSEHTPSTLKLRWLSHTTSASFIT